MATLQVAEGGRLVIGAWAGEVFVSAGSRCQVEVALRCRGVLPAPVLEIERDGDDVYVDARTVPLLRWLAPWAWRGMSLEVSVPAHYSVDVATSAGRVEIDGVDGEVEARSQAGHLVFRDVRGPIDGRTGCGSIDVSDCRGDVDVTTARGSIAIQNVQGQVCAHAHGGRIAVLDAAGELVLRSGGGRVLIDGARGNVVAFA